MAADRPLELESFLGTVPGMIYRSRLAPEPYFIEFVSDEMTSIAGYPATDCMGPEPKRTWGRAGASGRHRGRVPRPAGGRLVCLDPQPVRKLVGENGSLWVHGAALDVTARHEAEDLRRRLEAEHARADALEESRARIVEAGDEARRRLSATCTTAPNSGSSCR